MEGTSTESLRASAAKWSLAGDEQLLHLLQKTHERIVSKCQDINGKMDEMTSALNNASIDLQNVNNKFMALSNSQFIESRVYDDDDVLATDVPPAEMPPVAAVDEMSTLRASLGVLARAHDTAEIVDDSDSDSDAEISVVLKPKDMYPERPLPYIIGSQQWRNKWHAGLIVEDSDTDSSTSERDREGQYSDTESEGLARPERDDNTLSESGSSLGGSLGAPASVRGAPVAAGAPLRPAEAPARPADIAAALARRLAVPEQPVIQKEPAEHPAPEPDTTVRKLIKPELPLPSNIFPDEPPPLEVEDTHSSDDDIFAEINKHTPYTQKNPVRSNVTDDLFSFDKPPVDEGDIFSDFAPDKMETKTAKQKSTLFEGDSEPELFAEPPPRRDVANNNIAKDEPSSKKPVGGISLFGSNKGTESIGAAILKRNQRKSSTSDEDSGNDNLTKQIVQNKPKVITRNIENTENKSVRNTSDETDNTSITKKEKAIFDDLFSKPNHSQKKSQNIIKESIKNTVVPDKSNVKEQKKTNVKDLFSDNIFDDIDDIFTSNVKIPSKTTSNQKSIFDDDDLFSDIDIAKSSKPSKNIETNVKHNTAQEKKSIFDSDDDLFTDVKTDIPTESHKVKVAEIMVENKNETVNKTDTSKEPSEVSKQRDLFDDSPQTKKVTPKPEIKSKSIFDSDSESDDIFAKVQKSDDKKHSKSYNIRTPELISNNKNELNTNNKNLIATDTAPKENTLIQSPSLFEEDEIDDLFIAANKLKSQTDDDKDLNITKPKLFSATEEKLRVFNTIPELENSVNANYDEKETEPKSSETITAKTDITFDNIENSLLAGSKIVTILPAHNYEENLEVIESSQDYIIKSDPKETFRITSETKIPESNLKNNDTNQYKDASKTPESQQILETQTVSVSKSTVTPELKAPIPHSDVFDDIFAEPPAFEKPVEPKKSKNVNALFDDDSDDESVFFKKNDVISDEKPEIFCNNVHFDIFVNEPPAIDVDFTTKSSNNSGVETESYKNESKIENTSLKNDNEENTSNSETNETVKQRVSQLSKNSSDIENELFSTLTNKNVPILKDSSISDKEISKAKEDLFAGVPIVENNVPVREIHEVTKVNTDDNKSKDIFESKRPISLFDDTNDEDLFTTVTEKRLKENPVPKKIQFGSNIITSKSSDSDEELFASLPSLPKSSDKDKRTGSITNTVDKGIIESSRDIFKPTESPKKEAEIKKIGKINTKNFNINVNALVPGASPKKVSKENKDDQKSMEEPQMAKIIPNEINIQPKPVNKFESDVTDQGANTDSEKEKSVTFDDKSESGVLDNKVSKQRARIQVKRRPSSRRARHEAARRSAIDFGDDTDNSSSFDEPKPKTINTHSHIPSKHTYIKDNTEREKEQSVSEATKNVPDSKTDILESNKNVKNIKPVDISEHVTKHLTATEDTNEQKPTTTKVVYILNDEDIFNTDPKTVDTDLFESKNVNKSQNLSTDDVDNLFKSMPGINTSGNAYNNAQNSAEIKKEELSSKITKESVESIEKGTKPSQKDKLFLFDDSDEELFGKKKEVKKKTTIFDSDSEEELFSGKKSKEKNNKEQKNKQVKEKRDVIKSSLFSDDDDDDLFSLRKDNKSETKHKPIPSTSKEVSAATTASKPAEPVFSDPLSLLGNDD